MGAGKAVKALCLNTQGATEKTTRALERCDVTYYNCPLEIIIANISIKQAHKNYRW
jgi:hypothetical protein